MVEVVQWPYDQLLRASLSRARQLCNGTQFSQFSGYATATSFDTVASSGSEPRRRLFGGASLGVVAGRGCPSAPGVATGCLLVVDGSTPSASVVKGGASGGSLGLVSMEVLGKEVEVLSSDVEKDSVGQLHRRDLSRKFWLQERSHGASSVRGQQEGMVALASGSGSVQSLLSGDLHFGSSSLSKLGVGTRSVVDADFVDGVLNVEGVKKGQIEGGLLSPVVADLVLSAGTAFQAR